MSRYSGRPEIFTPFIEMEESSDGVAGWSTAATVAVAVERGRIRVWEMGRSVRSFHTRCFEKVIFCKVFLLRVKREEKESRDDEKIGV